MNDAVDVVQDFIIPKPKNSITFRQKKFAPLVIQNDAAHLAMLSAINFDYEPSLMACKVCEIRSDGCLTPKM